MSGRSANQPAAPIPRSQRERTLIGSWAYTRMGGAACGHQRVPIAPARHWTQAVPEGTEPFVGFLHPTKRCRSTAVHREGMSMTHDMEICELHLTRDMEIRELHVEELDEVAGGAIARAILEDYCCRLCL